MFGANESTNAGAPMVSPLTSVRWRGRKMNAQPANPMAIESIVAYTVLVRNRFATRSMLPITLRPSPTTLGSVAKLPSSRTS